MDLSFSADEELFRKDLRGWLADHVDPEWRKRYRDLDSLFAYLRQWDRELFDGGWGAIEWPREHGGIGASAVQSAIFAEENARIDAPEGLARIGKRLVAPALLRFGTDAQKAHLPRILRGDEVWCQGFSEPEAGSDLAALRTRAERRGDGWVINGGKIWTSFAQYADFCFLLARTGSLQSGKDGISVFLVDMQSRGLEVRPLRQATGVSEFNQLSFDDVLVSDAQRLGEVDGGWASVELLIAQERNSDYALRRCMSIRHALERGMDLHRKGQGRSGARSTEYVGESYARAFGMQLLAFELLSMEAKDAVPPAFGSLVKLFVTEGWKQQNFYEILHLDRARFDDLGVLEGEEWVFDYMESFRYTISGGTSEMLRNGIARSMLGLPSSKPSAR